MDGQEDRLEKLKKIREMLKQNNPQNIPKPPSKSSDVRYRYYDFDTEVYLFLYFIESEKNLTLLVFISEATL